MWFSESRWCWRKSSVKSIHICIISRACMVFSDGSLIPSVFVFEIQEINQLLVFWSLHESHTF